MAELCSLWRVITHFFIVRHVWRYGILWCHIWSYPAMVKNPWINSAVHIRISIQIIEEEDQATGIVILVKKNQVNWSNSFRVTQADRQTNRRECTTLVLPSGSEVNYMTLTCMLAGSVISAINGWSSWLPGTRHLMTTVKWANIEAIVTWRALWLADTITWSDTPRRLVNILSARSWQQRKSNRWIIVKWLRFKNSKYFDIATYN